METNDSRPRLEPRRWGPRSLWCKLGPHRRSCRKWASKTCCAPRLAGGVAKLKSYVGSGREDCAGIGYRCVCLAGTTLAKAKAPYRWVVSVMLSL